MVIGFSACKKDDSKTNKLSSFSYNGVNYETPNAYLVSYGATSTESADFDIYLTSSDVTVNSGSGLTGTGDGIYMDLNSSSLTELADGTYTWSIDRAPNTIVNGAVLIAYNFGTLTGDSYVVTDGTIKITVSGTNYVIDYSLTLSNDQTVTGNYNGTLQEYTSSYNK